MYLLRKGKEMSHNPNTIESQSELNTCNDGKRSSDVLLSTIAELEKVKKENDLIKSYMQQIRSVIQYANIEQICTEYRVKIIKIIDNLLYRS
jgi:hypothetical protein